MNDETAKSQLTCLIICDILMLHKEDDMTPKVYIYICMYMYYYYNNNTQLSCGYRTVLKCYGLKHL